MEAKFVDIHTHRRVRSGEVLAFRNILAGEISLKAFKDNQPVSLGYHPWEIKEGQSAQEMFEAVKNFLSATGVALIGETGLDKAIQVPFDVQQELFELHIEASEQLKKPLIIHCVRAFSDLIAIKKALRPKMPWIIHGYQSNSQVLEQLLNKGIYISFGESLLHDEEKFRKLLLLVPENLLLFETDDSDLSIDMIFQKAAFLLKTEMEDLKTRVYRNAQTLLSP